MSKRYKCPNCEAISDHFQISGSYTEYGSATGYRTLGESNDWDDTNCSDCDYEEESCECPECNKTLAYEFTEKAEESDMEIYDEDEDEKETKEKTEVIEEESGKIEMGKIRVEEIYDNTTRHEAIVCKTCQMQQIKGPELCFNCESELN